MIVRLVGAVVVAVAAGLVTLLIGIILGQLHVPIAEAVANFLTAWCWVIGLLAGLWWFVTGRTIPPVI